MEEYKKEAARIYRHASLLNKKAALKNNQEKTELSQQIMQLTLFSPKKPPITQQDLQKAQQLLDILDPPLLQDANLDNLSNTPSQLFNRKRSGST